MAQILRTLVTLYIVIVFGRVLLSWFPVRPGTAVASIARVLYDLTEPVLAPLRRLIPPVGVFDLSATILLFGLLILRQVI